MEQNYIILTENDTSAWEDVTGERYHFPNKYQRLVLTGATVLYYKCAMKDKSFKDQRLSVKQHYFGTARIGNVYPDPAKRGNFFADIIDYVPFEQVVYFKDENDRYFEEGAYLSSNYWRDAAVRKINRTIFERILEHTEFKMRESIPIDTNEEISILVDIIPPNIKDVKYELSAINPLKPKPTKSSNGKNNKSYSRTKSSKKIGDRGEEIVLNYLKDNLNKNEKESLRWLARENEKPGYDLVYLSDENRKVCVEVKATTASSMTEFILTINEWEAAMNEEFYQICLVTQCMGNNPQIYNLGNPVTLEKSNELMKEVASYKMSLVDHNIN